ncbi:hypothetical protein BSKO_03148 [Bryopsis sp. KO-2023]|nr:hypothetical protein BSKO_03148 [Bryopsis sp. KO-2023]
MLASTPTKTCYPLKTPCCSRAPTPSRLPGGNSRRSLLDSASGRFLSGTHARSLRSSRTAAVLRRDFPVVCAKAGESLTVAVTGATGLIGARLVAKLASLNHKVVVLTRDVGRAKSKLPYPGISVHGPNSWESAICGCDAVVNLAGEPIATRWSPAIKDEIKTSRVKTTRRIAAAINACPEDSRPKILVNSSAVGFYGSSLTASLNESSPSGTDYLAEICREWEAAAKEAKDTRVVLLRTGIVLAPEGGALGRMLPVFQIFAGGPLGTGQQWVSWIHRDDVVGLIVESIQNKNFDGAYNATAPNPVRMGEFCNAMGQVLGRPSWLLVPEFALQTLLGEGAMLVVEGQRVLPVRTEKAGYKFTYPSVIGALRNLLAR